MPLFFAELGRHPALSAAEILIRSAADGRALAVKSIGSEIMLLDGPEPLPGFAAALGGTLRFGAVLVSHRGAPQQEAVITDVAADVSSRTAAGKTTFGLSAATLDAQAALPSPAKLRAWGLSIKKMLRERGSIRLLTATTRLLSPVAVTKNGLIAAGGDYLLLVERDRWHLARSSFVHDFEGQARREFERPVANPVSGMLPVQLARIMVNLSGRHGTLLDPFCGSGTVLGEAMLLGFARVIGSDVSHEEIEASRANLAWLATSAGIARAPELIVSPVGEIGRRLPRASVDAVVTEPFLGPPLRGRPQTDVLRKTAGELRRLYKLALAVFSFVLKTNGRVVMIFPRFDNGHISTTLPDTDLKTMGYRRIAAAAMLPAALRGGCTPEGNLRYARQDAQVVREIVILEKQS